MPKGKKKARESSYGWGKPRERGKITPSSLIQLGLVFKQRETIPHVFQRYLWVEAHDQDP